MLSLVVEPTRASPLCGRCSPTICTSPRSTSPSFSPVSLSPRQIPFHMTAPRKQPTSFKSVTVPWRLEGAHVLAMDAEDGRTPAAGPSCRPSKPNIKCAASVPASPTRVPISELAPPSPSSKNNGDAKQEILQDRVPQDYTPAFLLKRPFRRKARKGVSARRCLFGKVDSDELQKDCAAVMSTAISAKSKRWGFDFNKGVPLQSNVVTWELVASSPAIKRSVLRRSVEVPLGGAIPDKSETVTDRDGANMQKKYDIAVKSRQKQKQTTLTFKTRKKTHRNKMAP